MCIHRARYATSGLIFFSLVTLLPAHAVAQSPKALARRGDVTVTAGVEFLNAYFFAVCVRTIQALSRGRMSISGLAFTTARAL